MHDIFFTAWFVSVLIVAAIAWIADRKINKKPAKRACKNCFYLGQTSGVLFCWHALNNSQRVRERDYCPRFQPYGQPSEHEVVSNYLERCLEQ